MPLPPFSDGQYSERDWRKLRAALAIASGRLGRPTTGHASSARLARTIMTLFDSGVRDVIALATAAEMQELSLEIPHAQSQNTSVRSNDNAPRGAGKV